MATILNDNFDLRAPKPIDKRTMKMVEGVSEIYNSITEANIAIIYRNKMLTVPILMDGEPVEHWYKDGTNDEDLVPKNAISTNLIGFIKGNGVRFISVPSILDGDIASLNFAKLTSKPSTLGGYGITDAQPFIAAGTIGQYWSGNKTWQTLNKAAVGLPNVDNTSDINKPLSTATTTALSFKQDTISLTTTGVNSAATLVGATLNIPTYDGSETKIIAGTDIVISGIGIPGNPYIINSTATGGGGGSGVTSFNGRVGVVVPVSNDYTFAQLASKPTTLAGYGITDAVPSARTISINGTSFDLSANRSWSVGTVTSFSSGALSPLFTTSVSNATSTPALSFTLSNQAINTVFAGGASGSSAAPTFRALVEADIPTLAQSKITNLVSDLAGKQATLVSGTNIKTVNGNSLLGSGNITIAAVTTWGSITGTLSSQSDLNTALNSKQATLVSGSNIKTINGNTVLGSGDLIVTASGASEVKLYTVANLRLETAPSTGVRYYTTNIGMEGLWYYDNTDTTTADNTGLVLVSTNGKRYKRIYDGINVDVKWFGVLGNNTNETTLLQLAFDNTAGKHLIIENITIRTYGNSVSGNNRKVIGKNGIIKYYNGGTQPEIFWYIAGDNIAIEELEFDLEGLAGDPNSGTTVMYFQDCDYVDIRRNRIHDNGHAGMKIVGGTNFTVDSNRIWNTDSAIFCLGGVQNLIVTGNTIWGGTSEGIGIFSHSTDSVVTHHAIVTNNYVYNKVTSAAFNFSRTFELILSDNNVDNCYAGAYFQDSGSGLAWNQISKKVKVFNNNFTRVIMGLINVSNNFIVEGNSFDDIGRLAIACNGNIDASSNETIINYGINISNNKFVNGSSLLEGWPIVELKHLRNLVFHNNQFTETNNTSMKCIRFFDITGVISDTYAPDSKIENFDTISYTLDLVFKNNVFHDIDLSPTYPLSGGQTFKWKFLNNEYKLLDASPTSSTYYLTVNSGAGEVNTRFIRDWYIVLTGFTITSLRPSWYDRRVTLQAAGSLNLTHGTNLQLVGATNAVLSANQRITFRCEGTIWREEYRSLI